MPAPRHPTFIVNPTSGGGATGRRDVDGAIRAVFPWADIRTTQRQGHATFLAREARAGGADLVGVVGGDGTVNEVVNGLLSGDGAAPMPTLAILPSGTGCALARSLAVPREIDAALQIALEGRALRVDAGRISLKQQEGFEALHYFLNIASCGASGDVVRRVNRSKKRLGPTATFALATVMSSLRYKGSRVAIRADGRDPLELHLNVLFICNGQYCGSGMRVGRGARMDDGKFKVVAVEQRGVLWSASKADRLYSGELEEVDGAHIFEASHVEVRRLDGPPVLVEADGEQPGSLPAIYELLPGALTLKIGDEALIASD